MPDVEPDIYERLNQAAARVPVPGGDVRAVEARGRRRRNRTRVASSVAAAAMVGAAVGVVATHGGAPHQQVVSGSTAGQPLSGGSASLLSWHTQPVTNGLSMAFGLTTPSGGTSYAVSTGPGLAPADGSAPPMVLYKTSNGATWTPVAAPPGVSVAGIALDGSRIYDVGTGTATATTPGSPSSAAVAWSDDGGSSWTSSPIPLDYSAPAGALTVGNQVLRVAAGSDGVVVAVAGAASLDLQRLLPAGVHAGAWTATPQGVELLGAQRAKVCPAGESTSPAVIRDMAPTALPGTVKAQGVATVTPMATSLPAVLKARGVATTVTPMSTVPPDAPVAGRIDNVYCYSPSGAQTVIPADQAYAVTGTYTWSQLGLNSEAGAAVAGETSVFFSRDGKSWQHVSLPSPLSSQVFLSATSSGFAIAGTPSASSSASTTSVLLSSDGKQWTAAPALPGGGWVDGLGALAGNVTVVLGNGQNTSEVYGLIGGSWSAERQLGTVNAGDVAFGPLGLAVVDLPASPKGAWQVQYSPDGSTWQTQPITTPSHAQVVQATVAMGPGSVVVTATEAPTTPGGASSSQVALIGTPDSSR